MNLDQLIEKKLGEAESLQDLVFVLEKLLQYNSVWEDGTLYSIRQLVEYVNGLKIEIFHNEHPPPYFHVITSNFTASFTVENCELLHGSIGGRERKIIEWWHKRSKNKLLKLWNITRPSNCGVGPININLPN